MQTNHIPRPPLILGSLLFVTAFWGTPAFGIPIGDAFETDDGSRRPIYDSQTYNPTNQSHEPMLKELNPTLNPKLNLDHPYPEYLQKFMNGKGYPEYYRQLLEVPPDDQVQSKVFNPEEFKGVRRIGVIQFENKTQGIDKDEQAGSLVAEQVSTELDTVGQYAVIHPKKMVEEYQMKMMTTPESRRKSGATSAGNAPQSKSTSNIQAKNITTYDLPYSADKIDAVMIGAVTRYGNTFFDQDGKRSRSPGVALEFGAYLISTKTGEAIWGARFVGSQKPSIRNIRFGKFGWLNKREFTQMVVSKVLKDFSNSRVSTSNE